MGICIIKKVTGNYYRYVIKITETTKAFILNTKELKILDGDAATTAKYRIITEWVVFH